MSAILITGGAGYIGSEVAAQLLKLGFEVIVVDNLSTGDRRRIPNGVDFYEGDISDQKLIESILINHSISTVFHFAAYKQARESFLQPSKYWTNNVRKLIVFLETLKLSKIKNFVLSSSCSVYGDAGVVRENSPLSPVSPYGWSKLVGEELCADYSKEFEWKFISLRYFNVIGASQRDFSGDYTSDCLLPTMFRKLFLGEVFTLYGNDFPTKDGFAVRDYISVIDVASAHIASLKLFESGFQGSLNVSTGEPISVYEIVKAFQSFGESNLAINVGRRNLADPAEIWGQPSQELLHSGWKISQTFLDALSEHWKSFQIFYQPPN